MIVCVCVYALSVLDIFLLSARDRREIEIECDSTAHVCPSACEAVHMTCVYVHVFI